MPTAIEKLKFFKMGEAWCMSFCFYLSCALGPSMLLKRKDI